MKKELMNFQASELTSTEVKNVKGGLRYETRNFSLYANKLSSLYSKGNYCKTGHHDGVYCIEW